jgi:hypothetical protein
VSKTWKRMAVVTTLGGVLAAGVSAAIAAIPDSGTGGITGCYANSNGALRVINAQSGATCTASEHRITWPSRGIRSRGAWSPSPVYYVDDLVTYNGQSYLARLQNVNVTPTNTANWLLLAARGTTGLRGPAGPGPGTALQATNQDVSNPEEYTPVELASFALPAGSWLVQTTVVMSDASSTEARYGTCVTSTDDGSAFVDAVGTSGPLLSTPLVTTRGITVTAATELRVACYWQAAAPATDPTGVVFTRASLVATPLDGVTDHNDTTSASG